MKTTTQGFLSSLRELGQNCATLFKLEAELTKREVKEEARRKAMLSGIAVGGVVIALIGCAIALIGLASWAALLFTDEETSLAAIGAGQFLVGVLAVTGGGVTTWFCLQKMKERSLVPRQSIDRIKHDVERISQTEI